MKKIRNLPTIAKIRRDHFLFRSYVVSALITIHNTIAMIHWSGFGGMQYTNKKRLLYVGLIRPIQYIRKEFWFD